MAVQFHEKWPVDFDALEIGDVIEPEIIEKVYGIERTEPEYSLKAKLPLMKQIHDERPDLPCVKSCGYYGLMILSHQEAADWQPRLVEHNLKQLVTRGRMMQRINQAELTAEQQNKVINTSRRVLAVLEEDRRQKRLLRLTKGKEDVPASLQIDGGGSAPDAQREAVESVG